MVIQVEELVKRYGSLMALDHFEIEIKEGEVFGLLGPNGSGKSTAINCILSLLKYDKGTIKVFDKPMKPTAYDLKKDIGVVMQDVAVFNELTVRENIDYFCGLYIKNKSKRTQLVEEAIAFCGLEDFRKFYPKKLSGGLLRRLNIACGIAHKPKLIILDEPTVAVDPQSRNSILEGILKLKEQGATILYTSHYMEEVEQICSRIAIMDKGKVVALGTKEELKSMIGAGEKITIEVMEVKEHTLQDIEQIDSVAHANYEGGIITVKTKEGMNSLLQVLDYLETEEISIGKVYSEQPTLNDVFLAITGKELRDNV